MPVNKIPAATVMHYLGPLVIGCRIARGCIVGNRARLYRILTLAIALREAFASYEAASASLRHLGSFSSSFLLQRLLPEILPATLNTSIENRAAFVMTILRYKRRFCLVANGRSMALQ